MGECTCRHNSDPATGDPEALLDQARYFPDTQKPIVAVDACIAPVIEALWQAGVRTGGCCCGHNGTVGFPMVFLMHFSDAEKAFKVLSDDDREWHVYFWAGKAIAEEEGRGDPKCAKCGHPKSNHPYRHRFVSAASKEGRVDDRVSGSEVGL